MEEMFKVGTLYLSMGVELVAAVVIAIGMVEALIGMAVMLAKRGDTSAQKEAIRLHFGQWLSLALEFLLAADILRTAVAPTWDEIGKLAAIVVLRTALNFFLQREIDEAASRRKKLEHPADA